MVARLGMLPARGVRPLVVRLVAWLRLVVRGVRLLVVRLVAWLRLVVRGVRPLVVRPEVWPPPVGKAVPLQAVLPQVRVEGRAGPLVVRLPLVVRDVRPSAPHPPDRRRPVVTTVSQAPRPHPRASAAQVPEPRAAERRIPTPPHPWERPDPTGMPPDATARCPARTLVLLACAQVCQVVTTRLLVRVPACRKAVPLCGLAVPACIRVLPARVPAHRRPALRACAPADLACRRGATGRRRSLPARAPACPSTVRTRVPVHRPGDRTRIPAPTAAFRTRLEVSVQAARLKVFTSRPRPRSARPACRDTATHRSRRAATDVLVGRRSRSRLRHVLTRTCRPARSARRVGSTPAPSRRRTRTSRPRKNRRSRTRPTRHHLPDPTAGHRSPFGDSTRPTTAWTRRRSCTGTSRAG